MSGEKRESVEAERCAERNGKVSRRRDVRRETEKCRGGEMSGEKRTEC